MNDKYSLAKCEQYGRRLAAKLCDTYFGTQPEATLDGSALLKFTSVRQLNLLVLHQLLTQWQAEAGRLRSPYFDFEAAPVQAALSQFMNVLSRHIRLDRAALEPLLARAAADTLSIVADSAGTFQRILLGDVETTTAEHLRDNLRYLDVDKAFYQGFVDYVPPTGELTREFLTQRFVLYHKANYKVHQPMQRLVGELSNLLPLTAADLLEDGPVAPGTAPAVPVATAPMQVSPAAASPPIPMVPSPAIAPAVPVFVAQAPPVVPAPVAPAVPAPAPQIPQSRPVMEPAANTETTVPLHEKLKANQAAPSPLAATLRAADTTPSFSDRSAPKVATLREAISINQRFSFINELFNGENSEYHAAIQHLDALPTADQARAYVTNDLTPRFDWARKEEHVNKLLKLIDRKFAA